LKILGIYDVKHLSSLENFTSVVHLEMFRNTDMERISNPPKLQKLVIIKCPKLKVLEGIPALQRLNLLDDDMEKVPRYLRDIKPRHLLLDCSLRLLTSIAEGKSGPEWNKFSHIQQVKAYADDAGVSRKWCMLYTRDPFHLETNISHSAIARGKLTRQLLHLIYCICKYSVMFALISCFPPVRLNLSSTARNERRWLAYMTTSTIEDERLVGRRASTDKHQPLCLRFR
jgi:hypothetical protein